MNARRLIVAFAAIAVVGTGWSSVPATAAEIESTIAKGGRLYDNWAAELKTTRPEDTHPAYPASARASKQTWRCVTCHGWDYNGNKELGIKGINGFAGKDVAAIKAVIRDATHAYTPEMLPDAAAETLALFVSKGQIDMSKYVDVAANKAKGDAVKGEVYYNTLCGVCHGNDGKKVSTGRAMGAVADAPLAVLHKSFNGQPAEAMPMLRAFDHSVSADIVTYLRQLPK